MKDVSNIISDLEQQKAAIDRAIAALREVAGGGAPSATKRRGRPPGAAKTAQAPKERRLSEEGRKRIVEALKKRWALKRSAERAAKRASKKSAKKVAVATAT